MVVSTNKKAVDRAKANNSGATYTSERIRRFSFHRGSNAYTTALSRLRIRGDKNWFLYSNLIRQRRSRPYLRSLKQKRYARRHPPIVKANGTIRYTNSHSGRQIP